MTDTNELVEPPMTTDDLRKLLDEMTPGPWEFEDEGKNFMGRFVSASGEQICDFGYNTTYYPVEGQPPEDADRRAIALLPTILQRLIDTQEALHQIIADCEADYPPSHGAIKQFAKSFLTPTQTGGSSHE